MSSVTESVSGIQIFPVGTLRIVFGFKRPYNFIEKRLRQISRDDPMTTATAAAAVATAATAATGKV